MQESNMVFQQCLACNTMMPEFCRSCICGHVFQNMKQIGGKRFSGYRAELYNKLETKRLKSMMKQTSEVASSSDEENTDVNKVIIKSPKPTTNSSESSYLSFKLRKKKTKTKTRRRIRRRRKISNSQLIDHKKSHQIVSPQLVARLTNALAEINKRILGQNLVWAAL